MFVHGCPGELFAYGCPGEVAWLEGVLPGIMGWLL